MFLSEGGFLVEAAGTEAAKVPGTEVGWEFFWETHC